MCLARIPPHSAVCFEDSPGLRLRRSFGFLRRLGLVAFGAREVVDDLGLLAGGFFFGGDVGVEELIADVGENGGAAGRDAAFGHEDEEAEEVFAKVLGGGEVSAVGEEILGEVGKVAGGRRESDDSLAEMIGTESGLRFQAGVTAALAVGEAIDTAGAGWHRAGQTGGLGLRNGGHGLQNFYVEDGCGHGFLIFL